MPQSVIESAVVHVHTNPGVVVADPDGSASAPYATFAEALELAESQAVLVKWAGVARIYDASAGAGLEITDAHSGRLTIQPWYDCADHGFTDEMPAMYLGVEIEAFGAPDGTSTNCYRLAGLSSKPAGVACGWLTRTTAAGVRKGWYQERSSLAACNSNAGSWYWDGTLLWVHDEASANLQADPSPNGHAIEWFRTGQGILLSGCSGVRLVDLSVWATVDPANAQGYGIRLDGCEDIQVVSCRSIDCGYHSIGAAGSKSIDILFDSCYSEGAAPTNDSYQVFYGGSVDVSGCIANRCEVVARPLLRWDATDAAPTFITTAAGAAAASQTAFTAHTGTGFVIAAAGGVRHIECSVRPAFSVSLTGSFRTIGFGNGSESAPAANPLLFDDYAYQIDGGSFECAGVFVGTSGAAAIAVRNAFLYGPDSVDVGGADGTNNMFVRLPSVTGGVTMLLVGCVIMAESSAGGSLVRMLGTSTLYDRSNTWIALGSTGVTHSRSSGQTIDSDQSVFVGSARICGGSTTGTGFSYVAGVYPTGLANYGPSAATNSEAEWAVHDSAGTFVADSASFNASTGEPDAGTFARITQTAPVQLMASGINGKLWDGRYGAFQYGDGLTLVPGRSATRSRSRQRSSALTL